MSSQKFQNFRKFKERAGHSKIKWDHIALEQDIQRAGAP